MNAFGFLHVATLRDGNLRNYLRAQSKQHHDFSKGKRGPVIPPTGKTRVTMWLDDVILEHFKGSRRACRKAIKR